MLVTIVAGARPNFMKIAPIIKAIDLAKSEGRDIEWRLIHTGQHYDKKMSEDFFEQLGIPDPDNNFDCGGGTQAEQTASIMVKFEKELQENRPDIVMVVGDVNSTMACAITAKKLCIDVAHVEAGIRSGDMTMPEEINRKVTDAITDLYFTTSLLASRNLLNQQVPQEKIRFVGNTMIDTLYQQINRIKKPVFWEKYGLVSGNYFLLTLHRPSNVDDSRKLSGILQQITSGAQDYPVIFPVHPRTRNIFDSMEMEMGNLLMVEPQNYLEFIYLLKHARAIITDSGGVTEEATVLNIPCLTMRTSTERPETVLQGTNELIGEDIYKIHQYLDQIIKGDWKKGMIPEYWDGHTSERIVADLLSEYAVAAIPEKTY